MKLTQYFKKFFESSQSSGIILILCVLVSLFIANSSLGTGFQNILDSHLGPYSVAEWINDGLMSVFFLLVGLEIKREMLEGELSNIKNASLPIFAAIGGMLVPALIYAFFNNGTEYAKGWGIPMATDIAFSLAIISMLSSRVPASIKIFLAALAIVDDLGAILVIAIFYTEQLHWSYLLISGGILVLLVLFNKLGIKKHIFYLIPGVALWYCMHHSGIHATIAGVLLAFTIPTNISDTEISPLEKLEGMLHTPVNYLIMPIFALANTNIVFQKGMVDGLFTSFGAGIIGGLIIGKLVGILLFSFIAVKLGISKLPQHSKWSQMVGVGLLAAIGFTMSIFIAILSFKGHQDIQDEAKFAILVASTLAGFAGYTVLKFTSKRRRRIN
ncbi:Na+/H+ antiporter NhaA [Elizabethkingia anophelis]|uniref:Na+/H+ antiporter NhaA n=1 Tax=Elizabethkingia anophelis TaxID=1117645 RepID=UPI0009951A83|nr:Na+/H+ antiporter NhaA [Elizabethkingia anophelis]AQW99657.1 Na+/H+ antiporter NhaA [Elizabethkingia anophelis]AQX90198.1 sodium:proton antiporter [Elizabethkingia anophelis]ASV79511.1 Na+/H+ antiporter NhaA [Elizabethkingia anophelis]EHM7980588.1 Na+/H+ antiporter NhaA [Elizabethkingia anophelis]EHM8031807.1 Na+/H+ antiporter NhaA [Elizabethkingia anophelis]